MTRFGKRLIKGLQEAVAVAKGEAAPARIYADVDVAKIRTKLKLSQSEFADLLGRVQARRSGLGAASQSAFGRCPLTDQNRAEGTGGGQAGAGAVRLNDCEELQNRFQGTKPRASGLLWSI